MPQISEKGMAMPSSPIRKLVPFADKAKERGIKVYHLNIGQPDIQTPDVALQALKTCNEKVIEYTHSAGNISAPGPYPEVQAPYIWPGYIPGHRELPALPVYRIQRAGGQSNAWRRKFPEFH